MSEPYRVASLHALRNVEIVVEADTTEDARKRARPLLRAQGVSDNDPLVVSRERPIAGESY
jgi:hypothetical protein